MIRKLRLTIMFTFGNKTAKTKLWNLSLRFRRGLWWFWSWLDSLQLTSKCFRIPIWTSSNQKIDKVLWRCFVAVRRFWRRRGHCLTRGQCMISSSHLQTLVYQHLYIWTWQMTIQVTHLPFKKKYFLLKLSSVLSDFIFFS
jgi:hypothetical protein